MARARPSKPAPAREVPPPPPSRGVGRRFALRAALHLAAAAGVVGGLAYGAVAAKQYVEQQDAAVARPLKVELADRPVWMGEYLAGQIAATVPTRAASPFDHGLLVDAAARLRANPWVRSVRQVRRVYGDAPGDTLVVDCEYRAPLALVQWGHYYWLVDNDGYKLPSAFSAAELPQVTVGRDGRTAFRVVTGVHLPPPADGHPWAGGDLSAALDVAKLFHGKAFLDGVTAIDVANFGGRVDRGAAQVVLNTRYGTHVKWGRPPFADDFFVEVRVARKLAVLKAVVRQYGRVDAGHDWLDIRFDTALLPADPPTDPGPAATVTP